MDTDRGITRVNQIDHPGHVGAFARARQTYETSTTIDNNYFRRRSRPGMSITVRTSAVRHVSRMFRAIHGRTVFESRRPPCTVIATATTVNEQHWLVYFRPLSPPEIRRIGTIANRATRRTLPYPRNERVKKNRRRRHSPSALTIVNAYQRLFVPIS